MDLDSTVFHHFWFLFYILLSLFLDFIIIDVGIFLQLNP